MLNLVGRECTWDATQKEIKEGSEIMKSNTNWIFNTKLSESTYVQVTLYDLWVVFIYLGTHACENSF